MKKTLLCLLILTGAHSAFAQSRDDITVSTDPARAAAVVRHAQELQSRPAEQMAPTGRSSATKMHTRAHHPRRHKHRGKKS